MKKLYIVSYSEGLVENTVVFLFVTDNREFAQKYKEKFKKLLKKVVEFYQDKAEEAWVSFDSDRPLYEYQLTSINRYEKARDINNIFIQEINFRN